MSLSIEQERAEISKAYNNAPTWVKRVKKMPDAQVHAIYVNLKNKGRI